MDHHFDVASYMKRDKPDEEISIEFPAIMVRPQLLQVSTRSIPHGSKPAQIIFKESNGSVCEPQVHIISIGGYQSLSLTHASQKNRGLCLVNWTPYSAPLLIMSAQATRILFKDEMTEPSCSTVSAAVWSSRCTRCKYALIHKA